MTLGGAGSTPVADELLILAPDATGTSSLIPYE